MKPPDHRNFVLVFSTLDDKPLCRHETLEHISAITGKSYLEAELLLCETEAKLRSEGK